MAKLDLKPGQQVFWIGNDAVVVSGPPVPYGQELEYVRGADGEKVRVRTKERNSREFDAFRAELIIQ